MLINRTNQIVCFDQPMKRFSRMQHFGGHKLAYYKSSIFVSGPHPKKMKLLPGCRIQQVARHLIRLQGDQAAEGEQAVAQQSGIKTNKNSECSQKN